MIRYSAIVPQRDAAPMFARRLQELCDVFARLGQTFEVICVDDCSHSDSVGVLRAILADCPGLRVVRLDRPGGLDAALSAGIAAARGEIIVAMEAGERYSPDDIPRLVDRLARADLVFGCRRAGRVIKIFRAAVQIPRRLLLGRLVRDPMCLFWAARREALEGLELARGASGFLPWLVAMRGYRVSELHVAHRWHAAGPSISRSLPNPGDVLSVWWQTRRAIPRTVTELRVELPAADGDRVTRVDPPQPLGSGQRQVTDSPRDRHNRTT